MSNLHCSEQDAGKVKFRVISYTWICPNCNAHNVEQLLASQVVCQNCEQCFSTLGTRDELLIEQGDRVCVSFNPD